MNESKRVDNKNEGGVKGGECPSLSRARSLPAPDCCSRRKCPVSADQTLAGAASGMKICHLWDEG